MRTGLKPVAIADDVFEFVVDSPARARVLATRLRGAGLAEEVVAGLDRVAVRFDPARIAGVSQWLTAAKLPELDTDTAKEPIEIGVHYGGRDGPDLEWICADLNVTRADLIATHTDAIHTVEMIGFTPGFAYLSGLPDTFKVSRLADPRPRVPAGSIGLSAGFTGLYALQGPGGWPIIGRTDAPLFDAARSDPFLLMPGQAVRFRAL